MLLTFCREGPNSLCVKVLPNQDFEEEKMYELVYNRYLGNKPEIIDVDCYWSIALIFQRLFLSTLLVIYYAWNK